MVFTVVSVCPYYILENKCLLGCVLLFQRSISAGYQPRLVIRVVLVRVNSQGRRPGRLCFGLIARVGAQAVDPLGLGFGFVNSFNVSVLCVACSVIVYHSSCLYIVVKVVAVISSAGETAGVD